VAGLHIRWSEHEARKPYARPFGVSFLADDGASVGSVAVNGSDLLYYRQFQAVVLQLAGELFIDERVDAAADPQRAWLDVVSAALPQVGRIDATPESSFSESDGRAFDLSVILDDDLAVRVSAATLLEYQEFQASVAHQSGRLYRNRPVEAVDDPLERHLAWMAALWARPKQEQRRCSTPCPGEASSLGWSARERCCMRWMIPSSA
jgi:hypothetical protein